MARFGVGEAKFTPGPWKTFNLDLSNKKFVQVMGPVKAKSRISIYDAYLIATSPELYSDLQSMCEMWRTVCEANGWDPEHMAQYQHSLETLEKARGEQS